MRVSIKVKGSKFVGRDPLTTVKWSIAIQDSGISSL